MLAKSAILTFTLAIFASAASADEERVQFPTGYATSFTNYLSLDRVQNPDQIIRLFSNPAALDAAAAGKELPDGAILVGEVYAAKKDDKGAVITSTLGRRIRDKLVAIAVMEKRKGWGDKYPAELRNGDWEFAIFSPDGKRLNKDLNTCRQCHAPLKDTQNLFSLQHLVK